jgi:hypothetical protein
VPPSGCVVVGDADDYDGFVGVGIADVFTRMIGILHRCLTTCQTYNENTAFPAPLSTKQPPPQLPLDN